MSIRPPTPPADAFFGRVWPPMLLVFACTFAAYLPAVGAGLVWNDTDYITEPALRSAAGLWRVWFTIGATQQYYPVLHSAFWVEHRLWGDAATGYHLANIFLHATAACLFALILRRLRIPGAWLAALAFALHPVCAESVAWISEQKNTLSTVFYLLAALAYLRWRGEGNGASEGAVDVSCPWFYWLATVLFVLAILSKSMAATLPGALLVVLWWKRGSLGWRADVFPLIPWFFLGAAGGLFTGWVERKFIGAEGSDFAFSLLERTLIAGRAVWFYLGKLFWPTELIFIYPRWHVDAGAWRQYVFPLGAFAFTAVLWSARSRTRGPLAAWLFFIGSLFPILGFLNVYAFVFSFVADHWQYLASLGIFAISAAALSWACLKGVGPANLFAKVFSGLLLMTLGLLTWHECQNYRDMETFYRTIIRRNPACWMAHNNLGNTWSNMPGRLTDEIAQYQEALRLKPDYFEAHNNLGKALVAEGRIKEAVAELETAIRLKPESAGAHYNLGNAWSDMPGRLDDAISQYQEALRLKPDYAEAHYNLGNAWSNTPGRLDEAIAQYREALRLKPNYAEARNNLGNALNAEGRTQEAIAELKTVIRLKPESAEAHNDLGNAMEKMPGRMNDAIAEYEEALRLAPKLAAAHYNLGNALNAEGRTQEAIARYEEALRLKPDYAEARNNLCNALNAEGRTMEAIAQYEEALRLRPDYAASQFNLAMALLDIPGQTNEAVAHLEAFLRLQPENVTARQILDRIWASRR